MYLKSVLICSILAGLVNAEKKECPPTDDEFDKMTKPLFKRFVVDICEAAIKPGGFIDVMWVRENVYPEYLNANFIGKQLPNGWEKDEKDLVNKCHNNTFNYCLAEDRKKVGQCFEGEKGKIFLKYETYFNEYCPLIACRVREWKKKHEANAMKIIDKYIKFKKPSYPQND